MRVVLVAVVGTLVCAALPSWAQAPDANAPARQTPGVAPVAPPAPAPDNTPAPSGRFTFNRVEGGYLRLDSQTGQVALCSARVAGWACEMVPEDRAALDKEIGRLQDEVAGLKQQLSSLREPSPRPPADLSPPTDRRDDAAKLREDMERARLAIENAWRRLVDMLMNFQRDMMRKG